VVRIINSYMNKSIKDFLKTLLDKMGINPQNQEEIIKTFTGTLTVTMLGVLTKSIPEEKQKELGEKLASANNWIEILSKEAVELGEKEEIVKNLNEQLKVKIDELIDNLVTECPKEKRTEVLAYVESFSK